MNKSSNHIPLDRLQAYLDQDLDQAECLEIESHLDQCAVCQEKLSGLELIFIKLENLPEIELNKDFTTPVLTKLREETRFSPVIIWTLFLEALGAAAATWLFFPAIQAASWLPQLIDTQTEIQAAINLFLTQLASSWLVWWAGLQLNINSSFKSLVFSVQFPSSGLSPWTLILAAGGIGLLTNFILLRAQPLRNQKHKH